MMIYRYLTSHLALRNKKPSSLEESFKDQPGTIKKQEKGNKEGWDQ